MLSAMLLFFVPQLSRADAFDYYTNNLLAKISKADGTLQVKELTPELLVEHNRVLPGIKAAFLVVKTNDGRFAKLLLHASGQKVGDKTLPILLIERFVTYKEGEERTIVAEGRNIHLFQDFHFNLDLGQIVPASIGGDFRLVVTDDKAALQSIGKAELYLVTKPLAEAAPKKTDKIVVGATFEPKYFNGSYKLYDDGRRTGKLVLKVANDGFVDGWYYSDKDGAKYEVAGKIGDPSHAINFKVILPRAVQEFQGWMFTQGGQVICGVSRLEQRPAGFYAIRADED